MSEHILIAYYSWSGNTRRVAQRIHEITRGTIFEILPLEPYPDNYTEILSRAQVEIREQFKPKLKSSIDNIDKYGKVFIGSSNWWNTIVPPVASFLTKYDFTGKTIVPFCTHGGGGQGRIVNTITGLCPYSTVSDCMECYGCGSGLNLSTIHEWIKNAGIVI